MTYSTTAILAGLRDVASWLENEKRDRHAAIIRHGIKRLKDLDPSTQELRAILHQAFSHPDAADHSAQVAGQPMLVKTDRGWYVLGEDGARFNLVSCMTPAAPGIEAAEPTRRDSGSAVGESPTHEVGAPESPPSSLRPEEAEESFQLMVSRIVYRHSKGLDLSEVMEQALGLLRRRGRLSALREEPAPSLDALRQGRT